MRLFQNFQIKPEHKFGLRAQKKKLKELYTLNVALEKLIMDLKKTSLINRILKKCNFNKFIKHLYR